MTDDRFTGDQAYLRGSQYRTPDKLADRQRLHTLYSTAPQKWFPWLVAQVPWADGPVVEVGCGPGHLWEEGRPPVRGSITLTDLSAGMVEAAVARASAAGYTVNGHVAPAERLDVTDASAVHVIANHMLYHVPHPPDAVAEIARVLRPDGIAIVATNGERHFRETKLLEHAVFSSRVVDRTTEAFGLASGLPMLEAAFADVELIRFPDTLRVTEADDLMAYMCSYPPVEDGDDGQIAELRSLVDAAFVSGGGVVEITKDVGVFLCREPRHR
ncbi:MAG: class I SAM-dependent methyltransferase [Acidimicrobiales bacterium]|nr:class I SAM-dependent methyltransferase [Acidimicrobiales bacterium]